MVKLIYLSGCQANLVTIRTVPRRSRRHNFPLRQFAPQCFRNRRKRVARTRHTHRGIHIGTSAQRVTDCPAHTGCRAAERFNLRRMVMCFVLEQKQPFFRTAFRFHVNFHRAGIDFLRFVQLFQLTLLF